MTDLLFRRRELELLGTPDSSIRKALSSGSLVRVCAGAYADATAWYALDDMGRHRMRVVATAERLTTTPVFSHFAAAALWGIRILGEWPTLVDVTLDRATGGRSDGGLRRRCTGLENVDVVELKGLMVTSPAQTVVDLARILPFPDGVVALDSGMHWRRPEATRAMESGIASALAAAEGRHGSRRAAAAVDFASPLSDSVEESHSRVWIKLLGFPRPELQQRFVLSDGSEAFTDFYWPGFGHVGECDGRAKYFDPTFRSGKSPKQVLLEEKHRENEIRRQVRMFSRWEPAELYPPRRLYDRLVRDGLPSSRRRL